MIEYYESLNYDPSYNLALEEYLFHYAEQKKNKILYLWQNDNTIVVGRNQNVYMECNMEKVNSYNSTIVRRNTGGGTVYHDLGNINFSIILPKSEYDIRKSTQVICNALIYCGIPVQINGRNDLVVHNKKISGNAYYSNDNVGLHHGTILVNADLERMEELLNSSAGKMRKNGIASVTSRVENLITVNENITIQDIKSVVKNSFAEMYKENILEMSFSDKNNKLFDSILSKYINDDWNIGKYRDYQLSYHRKFNWGNVDILIEMVEKQIDKIEIFSDSLFPNVIDVIIKMLNDNVDKRRKISLKLNFLSNEELQVAEDIINWWNHIIEKI